jgi:non-heme chloroperoxidase
VKHHTVDLAGRVRLDVGLHGDADGVPVIALHGVSDSRHSFGRLVPYLPQWLRLIAPSQRGHGDSERPAAGYRPADFADDLLALMDRLALERAVVLGHSMGSVNALRFAADHGERLLGLVLVGAAPAFGAVPELVEFWRRDIGALRDPVDAGFVRDFQLSCIAEPLPDAFIELAVAESLKLPAHAWRAAFDGFMTEDLRPRLPSIDARTMIVWGRHDAVCRYEDQQSLLAIPRARLSIYEACGHTPHWEEPQRFAHDLAAFAIAAAGVASPA